ncbi:hypothetical protein NEOLEDRAFT_1133864 [Neolentinus lepideus HHB14362 ss-1]|uniref:Uncharacterized protein n=1 Tax=Neolentinus lepideus HHB14362 ss-1 TaxID=1314782 RepID=A0A165SGG0_9AGAM|nr:hypothetical protein NEOLEDRAFT_1133864 [Neolentinus lepideus HHB14362 ss-1]
MDDGFTSFIPSRINGIVHLPSDSTALVDADEEVFLAYTRLSSSQSAGGTAMFRGLGHVDSRKDTLTVTFELRPPAGAQDGTATKRSRKKKTLKETNIEFELMQDTTSLRSRPGDTGSVLWQASIAFANVILQEHYYPVAEPFLEPSTLADAHILELGAGTGMLSILLAPMVKRYTVTDIPALLPLIRKNVVLSYPGWPRLTSKGGNIAVEELDWVTLQSASPTVRSKYVPYIKKDPPKLVFVVDCIYNPSLIKPLVDTIDYVSSSDTTVVVVSELRAETVVREFLDAWLSLPGWKIWSAGAGVLNVPYVVWIAAKEASG